MLLHGVLILPAKRVGEVIDLVFLWMFNWKFKLATLSKLQCMQSGCPSYLDDLLLCHRPTH